MVRAKLKLPFCTLRVQLARPINTTALRSATCACGYLLLFRVSAVLTFDRLSATCEPNIGLMMLGTECFGWNGSRLCSC